MDEVFLNINGHQVYFLRAVDQEGEVHDILVETTQCKSRQAFLPKAAEGPEKEAVVDKVFASFAFTRKSDFIRSATSYTDKPNPCAGVRGYKESGRNIYVEDEIFQAVCAAADQATQ